MTNISIMVLAQCLRLETSSRFMILLEWQYSKDLAIFDSRNLPFLISPYSPFNKWDT